MDKILVTGGAGFIGSHIVNELVFLEHDIIVVDDLSSGKLDNIKEIDKVKFINMDIRDEKKIAMLFKENNFDVVFHQAAIASVTKSIEEKDNTRSVNVSGSENIFKYAVENNVDKVIFASSAAVYGDNPLLPKNENMIPAPKSPYADHKFINEDMAMIYSSNGITQFLGLRYFNVYGENQNPSSDYSGVINIFKNKIANDQEINIYGDGEQTRDFIYIKDVVTANIMMLLADQSFAIYNVGTGVQTSLKKLVSILEEIYNKKININYTYERKGDIKHSVADITKINKTFSFKSTYTIEEGLTLLCRNN
jgi:UDP-glucose 4-epimerase